MLQAQQVVSLQRAPDEAWQACKGVMRDAQLLSLGPGLMPQFDAQVPGAFLRPDLPTHSLHAQGTPEAL